MQTLLLASSSPRRRELLSLLGMPFETVPPDVPETPQSGESPAALVARLSQLKARAVGRDAGLRPRAEHVTSLYVVACDTVVALDGESLGKPENAEEATTMLRRLRGRPHTVYSAVTVLRPATNWSLTDVAETQVTMRDYSDEEIAAYVAGGNPLDKAGAYAIQHAGFHPVAGVQGCYANVVGLPLCHIVRTLRVWGVEPPRDIPPVCQKHTGYRCWVYATVLSGK